MTETRLSPYATPLGQTLGRHGEVRPDPRRDCFERDGHRILHSMPFRRLRHKTQVFYSPKNDHICTRIEHALHVGSVSQTLTKELGLNSPLAYSIALGHDLGHPPFGHTGESVLNTIASREGVHSFCHEAQSLRVVDYFRDHVYPQGLNLTHEVRDGIVCHCGEVTERVVKPDRSKDMSGVNGDASTHVRMLSKRSRSLI